MPIPPAHMKERLSLAYVHAVAARAGAVCKQALGTEYGVDVTLASVTELANGKYAETGFIVSCQVKASTTCEIGDSHIAYDLEVGAYNKLVAWEGGLCILVLLTLPQDDAQWMTLDEESLVMRRCCYWAKVAGDPSDNAVTKRIHIPRAQVFDPAAVAALLDSVREGSI